MEEKEKPQKTIVEFSPKKRKQPISESECEMKEKLDRAKANAIKEIKAFEDIMKNAQEEIEKLALFSGAVDMINDVFLKGLLKEMLIPIIKGNPIPGMPPEIYKEMRKNLYKALIQKYEK